MIHILKNGQPYGPFRPGDVLTYVQNGNFTSDDLAWREGMAEWQPLRQVLDGLRLTGTPPISSGFLPKDPASNYLIYQALKKSRGMAFLLNFLLPGAGFIYAGKWITGALILLVCFVLGALVAPSHGYFLVVSVPIEILVLIFGFRAVSRYNHRLAKRMMVE